MKQTRRMSAFESVTQVMVGFMISWGVWTWIAAPIFGYEAKAMHGLGVVSLFTCASLLRQYVFRRVFNYWAFQKRAE